MGSKKVDFLSRRLGPPYRRTKKGIINTHIYYHCNRIRNYECKEPYITEKELIKQLIASLPKIKIDSEFLWQGFEDEIKRLNHLRGIMNQQAEEIRLTPHNTQKTKAEITKAETQMPKGVFTSYPAIRYT